MQYQGVIIKESLADSSILDRLTIVDTQVEQVTDHHQTPWVSQWTLHTVHVDERNIDAAAQELSRVLDTTHISSWYADFKNNTTHYIIFPSKVFKIDRKNREEYQQASDYGRTLGIPPHQLDFTPNVVVS